jgi:hypothetical protein
MPYSRGVLVSQTNASMTARAGAGGANAYSSPPAEPSLGRGSRHRPANAGQVVRPLACLRLGRVHRPVQPPPERSPRPTDRDVANGSAGYGEAPSCPRDAGTELPASRIRLAGSTIHRVLVRLGISLRDLDVPGA